MRRKHLTVFFPSFAAFSLTSGTDSETKISEVGRSEEETRHRYVNEDFNVIMYNALFSISFFFVSQFFIHPFLQL